MLIKCRLYHNNPNLFIPREELVPDTWFILNKGYGPPVKLKELITPGDKIGINFSTFILDIVENDRLILRQGDVLLLDKWNIIIRGVSGEEYTWEIDPETKELKVNWPGRI